MKSAGPLGLPGQVNDLPTTPFDKGDDTQERFRYQWAMGVTLLVNGFASEPLAALWCEYHEDFLVELVDGRFVAVQVKTDDSENARWRLSSDVLVSAIARFCELEKAHGARITRYEFCSNAPPYIPAATAKTASLASSPMRLIEACKGAEDWKLLQSPYKEAFDKLMGGCGSDSATLHTVLTKLHFRRGPSLRDCDAVLASDVVPSIPGCAALSSVEARRLRENLIGLVQTACRVPTQGIDGALAYLASNGQPQVAIRAKCITLQAALETIDQLRRPGFQFVDCGLGVSPQSSPGRAGVLQRKMRNAYISAQYDPLRWRMESAEQRLLERALTQADTFEVLATQIQGAVLMVCKDAEAKAFDISDDRRKGPHVYAKVLEGLEKLAETKGDAVGHEPVDTLMGVAGMLSGECRFAWGVPLEGDDDGA